jgi:hypothetical protein
VQLTTFEILCAFNTSILLAAATPQKKCVQSRPRYLAAATRMKKENNNEKRKTREKHPTWHGSQQWTQTKNVSAL